MHTLKIEAHHLEGDTWHPSLIKQQVDIAVNEDEGSSKVTLGAGNSDL